MTTDQGKRTNEEGENKLKIRKTIRKPANFSTPQ
jgi:hypothetical protein